jgi:hypothetical protein
MVTMKLGVLATSTLLRMEGYNEGIVLATVWKFTVRAGVLATKTLLTSYCKPFRSLSEVSESLDDF